jgi:hypothetical protein
MKKLIKATVTYTFQPTPADVQPPGGGRKEFELLDSDGFRDSFHDDLESATARVTENVEDALGLSGGVALGAVTLEVGDTE